MSWKDIEALKELRIQEAKPKKPLTPKQQKFVDMCNIAAHKSSIRANVRGKKIYFVYNRLTGKIKKYSNLRNQKKYLKLSAAGIADLVDEYYASKKWTNKKWAILLVNAEPRKTEEELRETVKLAVQRRKDRDPEKFKAAEKARRIREKNWLQDPSLLDRETELD